jgi:hypothetical protein
LILELEMSCLADEFTTCRKFQQRNTFLNGSASDTKEVSAMGFGESPVAFGYVGGNRKGGAIKLIDQKPVSAVEILRVLADGIGEVDGFLVDDRFSIEESTPFELDVEESSK